MDALTGEGLPFATLAYGGEGAYTNADGEYALTPGTADSVFISFIGYTTQATTLAALRADPVARLQAGVAQLTEIVVRGEDERLYRMLQRCRDDLRQWPGSVAKGYFQLATTLDGMPVEFMQNYYNVNFSGTGIAALSLKAGRVAVHTKDSISYRSLGTSQSIARLTLTERVPDFGDHPLQLTRGALKRNYYLSEVPEFSDAQTIHLRFEPKREGRQLFSGELWMDATTARLRKLVLRHPALVQHPLSPISDDDRIGAFDVEFVYTFAGRLLRSLQWQFSYDHHTRTADRGVVTNRVAADCSLICFDTEVPFFPPRISYSGDYGDYRKLAFFPYTPLFWEHAPQVPLTDRQRRQMQALGMEEHRIDYEGTVDTLAAGGPVVEVTRNGRNVFWSPEWRYLHKRPAPKHLIEDPGFASERDMPSIQIFLDAFPLGDSMVYSSATFLDVYATQLTVPPAKEFNAALNLYFDLCEVTRRELMDELRAAGNPDPDFINQTYDRHLATLNAIGRRFFREVRRGMDQQSMERYNRLVVEKLGINNLRIFKMYEYAWE